MVVDRCFQGRTALVWFKLNCGANSLQWYLNVFIRFCYCNRREIVPGQRMYHTFTCYSRLFRADWRFISEGGVCKDWKVCRSSGGTLLHDLFYSPPFSSPVFTEQDYEMSACSVKPLQLKWSRSVFLRCSRSYCRSCRPFLFQFTGQTSQQSVASHSCPFQEYVEYVHSVMK